MWKDIGLLSLRVVAGGFLAGHGSQKLFGWFQGPGIEGTSGFMGSLGLEPRKEWATAAGSSEFAGGVLTTLGLFHPIGPIMTVAPMITATRQTHWKTPLWATEGGAELTLTNLSIAFALATRGPGRLSLDHLLGLKVPKAATLAVLGGVVAGLVLSEAQTARSQGSEPESDSAEEQ